MLRVMKHSISRLHIGSTPNKLEPEPGHFIDETCINMTRLRGRAPREQRRVAAVLLGTGRRPPSLRGLEFSQIFGAAAQPTRAKFCTPSAPGDIVIIEALLQELSNARSPRAQRDHREMQQLHHARRETVGRCARQAPDKLRTALR